MNPIAKLLPLMLLPAAAVLCAQTTAPATAPAPSDVTPETRALLDLLHDRKATLKDFTAQIDNSVEHLAGDSDGNRGTVDYTDDPTNGPSVSVHFTEDTSEGKHLRDHDRYVILDSKALTLIDFTNKEYKQQLAPAGKPFDPTSLESPIPLPIGIDPAAIIKNFEASLQPSTDPNRPILRLIPRVKGTYDFTQFDITVDKKLQLPIQLVAKSKGGDTTTLKFLNPEINTGKAKIAPTTAPTAPGWNIEVK